jgi:hypothetical protein
MRIENLGYQLRHAAIGLAAIERQARRCARVRIVAALAVVVLAIWAIR